MEFCRHKINNTWSHIIHSLSSMCQLRLGQCSVLEHTFYYGAHLFFATMKKEEA